MKKILTITALIILASCGKQSDIDKLNSRVDDTNSRIQALERQLAQTQDAFNALSSQVGDLEADQDSLSQLVALNAVNLVNLQSSLDLLTKRVSSLESRVTVSSIYDPCGDKEGSFDEMLLIMSDGSILAYFEDGGKRFLSKLPDGNYRTTDEQACNFQVINGKIVD